MPSSTQLKGLRPQQALTQANQWRKVGGLQSGVTSEAVAFQFPDGKQSSVALHTDGGGHRPLREPPPPLQDVLHVRLPG
ncbi:hypothetical protein [Deinococcus saxicola]|uniref:hypothetical protein n=1 Tax=Deinococcus saxicola TaxID=249406 RepID=UPI0039F11087